MSDSNPLVEVMKLFRLWNGLIAVLGLILGAAVSTGITGLSNWTWELILGAFVVLLFVGAGNSLNDYFDIETDRIAHPDRPLPRGTLPRRFALLSSATMFAGCVVLASFINWLSLTIVILAIIAMIVYELRMKSLGLTGNVLIALLVAGLFEFSGSVVELPEKTLVLAALSGLATLGREIVKDIEDLKGDVARTTLPKRIGARNAGYVALIPTFIAVALSPVPYIQEQLTALYLLVVIIADALFVYGALSQFKNPSKGQKIYKVAMVVALIAFAVGVRT
ncbi:MAG: UbiA family prenyltransferase [Thermoplasmata archaeon]